MEEEPKRHAVPGEEPDIFENPLEVPCFRRTGLWTIGTSTATFLLRYFGTRSVPKAVNMMIPVGLLSATATWISCRREWNRKHASMRALQKVRSFARQSKERGIWAACMILLWITRDMH